MQNVNWKFIVNTIKSEKCVLLLGPELPVCKDGESIHTALCSFLDIESNQSISSYYKNDGFFLFPDGMAKTFVYYEMKDFFGGEFNNDLYKKIGQIPFHLIVSLNPDHILHNILQEFGIAHQFEYYKKKQKPVEVDYPVKKMPLVYNLFGSIAEEESLILTHDDLFDFLLTALGQHRLPTKLQRALNEADNFIFLGFGFDRWYLQLLVRILSTNEEKFRHIRYALNQNISIETKSFYIEQFKINFIDQPEIDFINKLFDACKKDGILREVEKANQALHLRLKAFLEKDEVENVLHHLKDFFADTVDEDIVMMQTSRYNRLNRNIKKGIIDNKEAGLELNRIKNALIELIQKVKEKEG